MESTNKKTSAEFERQWASERIDGIISDDIYSQRRSVLSYFDGYVHFYGPNQIEITLGELIEDLLDDELQYLVDVINGDVYIVVDSILNIKKQVPDLHGIIKVADERSLLIQFGG